MNSAVLEKLNILLSKIGHFNNFFPKKDPPRFIWHFESTSLESFSGNSLIDASNTIFMRSLQAQIFVVFVLFENKVPYHTKLSQGPFKRSLIKIDLIKSFLGEKCILKSTN